jgi:hypothetical protein
MATSENTEELPELETAALEELNAEALAPIEAIAPDAPAAAAPLANDDLNLGGDLSIELPADPVAAEPPPAPTEAAATPATGSAQELTDDILGGVDFDLPAPGPQATATPAPKPIAPTPAPAADGKSAAPFAFKPVTPAFASAGMPKPVSPFGAPGSAPSAFGSKPAPVVAKAAGAVDPKSLFGDAGDLGAGLGENTNGATQALSVDALREALTAEQAPANVPPDTLRLAFNLCRALVKKGIVSVDDLV